jgi:arylsulfatase A-like enzyme
MTIENSKPEGTSRREFLQGGVAATGATLVSSILPSAIAQPQVKRPNLLFILGEGQRADAFSPAGNSALRTPNMDRIAREGVWFKNSFCTNSLCASARATVLTGLYSHMTGALDNTHSHQVPLPADIPLFTDLLHQAGYEVAIVGKVHVKNGVKERYWDYYFGFNAPMTDYYKPKFAEGRNGTIGEEITYDGYADDLVTDRALAWLNEKREKPFCLLVWYQTPHAPFFRARRHLDLYNGVAIPKPSTFDDDLKGYPGKPAFAETDNKIGTVENLNATRTLEEVVKDYNAGLVAVDENIGRILRSLETNDELDNTAILLSSDHGFFLGEWRLYDKRFMHEPSIRVPMLLRYPKRIKGGTRREEMALDIDIAPTLLDLAGVPIPKHMQGQSMLNLTEGKREKWRKDWLYHYYEYPKPGFVQPHVGVRTERYKLIHYYVTNAFELYDLQNDPGELHNLAGRPEHSTIQATLVARLAALQKELGEKTGARPS